MKTKVALFLAAIVFLGGCAAKESTAPARPAVVATQSISDVLNEKMQEEQVVEEAPEEEPEVVLSVENMELPVYDTVDVDLLTLTADLRYAQVYDMCMNPDAYVGKVVKAQGLYSYWKNEETGAEYKTVIITDAFACCAQGIEFKEVEGQRLPTPYTGQEDASGCEITVTGVFEYYIEDGVAYIKLLDAAIE